MKNYHSLWRGSLFRGIEYVFDTAVVFFSLILVIQFTNYMDTQVWMSINQILSNYSNQVWLLILYVVLSIIFFYIYNPSVLKRSFFGILASLFLSLLYANLLLTVTAFFYGGLFLLPNPFYSLVVIVLQWLVLSIYKYLLFLSARKFSVRHVLVLGPKIEVQKLSKEFFTNRTTYLRLKYIFCKDDDEQINQDIFKYINQVDSVFLTENLDIKTKNEILAYASLEKDKEVYIVPKTYELTTLHSIFEQVDDTLVLKAQSMHLTIEQRFIKRTVDIIVSVTMLILLSWLMLIVALIIKLQDGGSVFYKQTRLKRYTKEFQIIKFRSMKVNADGNNGPTQAKKDDDRITKFGKFIRATRIDELPQLFNVLRGDMSLVGPRPLIPTEINEVLQSHPEFKYRSNVKPGLTGLSQVYSYYDTPLVERLRYDLLYIRKQNFLYDIKILFLTIRVMLSKEAGLGREHLSFEEILKLDKYCLKKIEDSESIGFELKKINDSAKKN